MLEARKLTNSAPAVGSRFVVVASISISQMTNGFNTRHDLLPAGDKGRRRRSSSTTPRGWAICFARTSWDKTPWLDFSAGP